MSAPPSDATFIGVPSVMLDGPLDGECRHGCCSEDSHSWSRPTCTCSRGLGSCLHYVHMQMGSPLDNNTTGGTLVSSRGTGVQSSFLLQHAPTAMDLYSARSGIGTRTFSSRRNTHGFKLLAIHSRNSGTSSTTKGFVASEQIEVGASPEEVTLQGLEALQGTSKFTW